jgi:hypothetical protein
VFASARACQRSASIFDGVFKMKRRDFIMLLGGAVTLPVTGRAQQTVPVVAFVFSGVASSEAVPYATAFKLGLERLALSRGRMWLLNTTCQVVMTTGCQL